jgi:hypothetical protein
MNEQEYHQRIGELMKKFPRDIVGTIYDEGTLVILVRDGIGDETKVEIEKTLKEYNGNFRLETAPIKRPLINIKSQR